jgi:hypothetical protein
MRSSAKLKQGEYVPLSPFLSDRRDRRQSSSQPDGPAAIDLLLLACRQAFALPFYRYVVRPLLIAGLASVMAVFIGYYALRYTGMFTEPQQLLASNIDATLARPAVFRVLVPSLLRGLYSVTPPYLFDLFESIERIHPSHGFRFFVAPFNDTSTRMLPYYYYILAISIGSLLLICILVSRIYRSLFPQSPFAGFMFAPYLLLLAAIVSQGVAHLYDFPAMLSALALFYCAINQWTWRYLVILPFACLTKETAILLTLFFAVYNFDLMDRRKLAVAVGLQALTFALVYGAVRYHFRHNGGANVENHLLQNIQWVLRPSIFAIPSILVLTFLTFFRWQEKPVALRSTLVVMAPALVLFLYGSFHGEIRNLYELFPYAALLICRNVELIARDCFRPRHVSAEILSFTEAAEAQAPQWRETRH